MFFLTDEVWFPDPENSDKDGLLAVGGDFSQERLLLAYRSGIFPWFMYDGLIYWFSVPQRIVLFPEEIHIGRSMEKIMRQNKFRITEDTAFESVIRSCAEVHEENHGSTWINEEFIEAYISLHKSGHAHSVEVWYNEELAGGIYGVVTGKVFCGESMFSRKSNASKAALIHLCKNGKYAMIDGQVPTAHLVSMGARLIPRKEFLQLLGRYGDSE